jgi:tetratricopeptide (TPR) repeat protein
VYSGEASQIIKLTLKNLREGNADIRFSSRDLAELLHDLQKKNEQKEDYVAIAKRLEEKMDGLGLSDVNLYQVMDDISNGRIQDVGELHQEFHKKAKYASRKDEEEFMDLLVTLWNKMPHKVIGGVSPEDKMKMLKRGYMEQAMIRQLMDHLQVHVRPEKYTSEESRRQALRRKQMKWLDTKMPELNGKSPREIILEERKKLGNDDTSIGYQIHIHPVYDSEEDEEADKQFNAGLRLTSQGKYREAVEAYRRNLELFPDNYVAWGNLGSVYCLLVDKKEAELCLRKALSINPDYQTAKNNLSLLKRTSVKEMKEMAKGIKIKFHKS